MTGRTLKRYRENTRQIAKDFAQKIGVAASYLSEIESGKRRATSQFLGKTAIALGMQPEEFTGILEEIASTFTVATSPSEAGGRDLTYFPSPGLPAASPPPSDEYRELSAWLVHHSMPKPRAWELLRDLTTEAEAGDLSAARRAKALLTILSES